MPEREDDHLTPATRLLEKRREMQEVEQALAAQKEVCCIATLGKIFSHARPWKYRGLKHSGITGILIRLRHITTD